MIHLGFPGPHMFPTCRTGNDGIAQVLCWLYRVPADHGPLSVSLVASGEECGLAIFGTPAPFAFRAWRAAPGTLAALPAHVLADFLCCERAHVSHRGRYVDEIGDHA